MDIIKNNFTIDFALRNIKLFCGLYESPLYNSETDYHLAMCLNEGEACNIEYDWGSFKETSGRGCVDSLNNELYSHDVITNIKYIDMISPKYHNYDTDRVVVECSYNFISLVKYCKHKHTQEFKQYLKNNFTSCDGFISSTTNSIDEFFSKDYFYNKPEECIQAMIEFYLTKEINLESHMYNMHNSCQEWLIDNTTVLQ